MAALQSSPALDELAALRRSVAAACARDGVAVPQWDERLARVASEEAASPGDLEAPAELQARVEAAGLGDPAPSAFLVEGPSVAAIAGAVAKQLPARTEAATHFGVGLARHGAAVRAVVVRSRRKAYMENVPGAVAPGQAVALRGRLAAGLQAPALYVEEPDGQVVTLPVFGRADSFGANLAFRSSGSYRVELMARGSRGPEVAWLYTIEAGVPTTPGPSRVVPAASSGDPRADALEVFDAINRDRLRMGVPSLAFDPRLAAVAQAYGRELRDLHILAHVSPRSGDLPARLRRAGYAYARAGENLAEGSSALEAHALAVQSPAHRRNMLDPTFDRCGIGVVEADGPGHRLSVIVTELFAGG